MEKLNERINKSSEQTSDKILSEDYLIGPFQVDGNNEFTVVFKDTVTQKTVLRFFDQPDSYDMSLLADYEDKVEFATWLQNGEIMLKIMDRFMVFD